ncbi:MAG: carboxylating nicotinate-nucleotide diphosphorylase [Candidatus Aminicenantes bacterium]|nr:carboxylating nicotinate-nucleotide diphosphorylase [Candidatus Aminicenantes bacterium]MCK5004663.1 carboxylating nicotinate-nucleotide diphosphorylase [Candidatus Aminicenantes bacterium]
MNHVSDLERRIILLALEEDEVQNDVTTNSLTEYDSDISALVIAKGNGIISGTGTFTRVFSEVDSSVNIEVLKSDGTIVEKGDHVIKLAGRKTSILKGERTALNFLQRLSGIASLTKRFTVLMQNSGIELLDTRKTTPGMRYLEKKAVVDGGGTNHRMNLKEMAMIKDNHIKMAGSISKAVDLVRENSENIKIEVEVTDIQELKEALSKKVDIIMLDNFNIDLLDKAVKLKIPGVKYEISGNVTLENIQDKLCKGIDFISSGALTHSFSSLDLSLEISE